MSNNFLTQEQIEKLLTTKERAIRETTIEDVKRIQQHLDVLIAHHRNSGMEEALQECLATKERLEATKIIVVNETEQQIFYTLQFPSIDTEYYTSHDSGFITVNKS